MRQPPPRALCTARPAGSRVGTAGRRPLSSRDAIWSPLPSPATPAPTPTNLLNSGVDTVGASSPPAGQPCREIGVSRSPPVPTPRTLGEPRLKGDDARRPHSRTAPRSERPPPRCPPPAARPPSVVPRVFPPHAAGVELPPPRSCVSSRVVPTTLGLPPFPAGTRAWGGGWGREWRGAGDPPFFPTPRPTGWCGCPPPVTRLEDGGLRGGSWGAWRGGMPPPPPPRPASNRLRGTCANGPGCLQCDCAAAPSPAKGRAVRGGRRREGPYKRARGGRRHAVIAGLLTAAASSFAARPTRPCPRPPTPPPPHSAPARSPCTRPPLPARR